jgi:hypothetical protein
MKSSTPVPFVTSSPNVFILGALESSNRALLVVTNRYSISLRSPTSAGMFPRHLMEFLKPSTPVRFVNSSSIEFIPGASESSNRALLDGTNTYSISRGPPNVSAEFDGIPQTIHRGPFRQCCINCLHPRCDRILQLNTIR